MQTNGTMKVAVFEKLCDNSVPAAMRATASILGEAAEWIRDEMLRKVPGPKGKEVPHVMFGFQFHFEDIFEPFDEVDKSKYGVRLYIHYDDNEKG